MAYEIVSCAAASLLAVFLLAGCNRFVAPAASPTITPSPSAIYRDSQISGRSIRYVFVASYEAQIGGMPTFVEMTYVCSDGTVQRTLERTDDIVLALQQGNANVSQILQSAANVALSEPMPVATEAITGPIVLTEYAGPSVFLEIDFEDGHPKTWVGDPDDMPDTVRALVNLTGEAGRTVPAKILRPGQPYIRSRALSPHEAVLARRAGLVVVMDREQLTSAPFVEASIAHPRRLIEIPSAENLYGAVPLSFTHGRSAHVEYQEQVFQIRHLLVGKP